MLFTHRGLSGPSILQISSYWREGEEIVVDLARGRDVFEELRRERVERPQLQLDNALAISAEAAGRADRCADPPGLRAWPIFRMRSCARWRPR